jgi:hypothetical protein
MRHLRALPLLAAWLALAAALPGQRRLDERRPISSTASIRVTLMTASGEVRVIGWDRDTVAVTGTIPAGDRFDISRGSDLRAAKMYVAPENDKVATDKPIALVLRVPARARLWIKAGGADLDVSGMTGGLDLNIVSGRIRVLGTPREVNAESMDGDVEISGDVAWLRAKTAGGAITLRGNGEDVGLTSVSGAVAATGSYARGRFETVTGDIHFDGTVEPTGALTFDSHSGTVELRVPRALGADFEVATITGTIVNELTAARAVAALDMRGRELGFSTGGGGAHIAVRTFKGSVALRRR